jgi:hypothetical protein
MISGVIDACWHPAGVRTLSSVYRGYRSAQLPAIRSHPSGMKRPVFVCRRRTYALVQHGNFLKWYIRVLSLTKVISTPKNLKFQLRTPKSDSDYLEIV